MKNHKGLTSAITEVWRKWMVVLLTLIALGLLVGGALALGIQPTKAEHGGLHGVTLDVMGPFSTFPDDVQAQFRVKLNEGSETQVSNIKDLNHAVFATVTFEPGGSADWHYHPGPVIVVVAEGGIKKIESSDCHEHTYEAGDAFLELGGGNAHRVVNNNPNPQGKTILYHVFLAAPEGGPLANFVEPSDC